MEISGTSSGSLSGLDSPGATGDSGMVGGGAKEGKSYTNARPGLTPGPPRQPSIHGRGVLEGNRTSLFEWGHLHLIRSIIIVVLWKSK